MLTHETLEHILSRMPRLTIGVLGDLFLDRYLDIDAEWTEKSVETGLEAWQVTRVRPSPGAAGTIINNLIALGVGEVVPISALGDDGEGYELRRALEELKRVDLGFVHRRRDWRTPTYTKPMFRAAGQPPRELNRLDIKNRSPSPGLDDELIMCLGIVWPRVDALIVLDQVGSTGCGVVTAPVRDKLRELGEASPDKLLLADSRDQIGLFRSVWLKPNLAECARATGLNQPQAAAVELARRARRPVFCTRGADGILLVDPRPTPAQVAQVPAWPVTGPIDIVGAGDSTSAGIACAVAAGANLEVAAAFGNLVASITIQQLGTTGTASPEQVRKRWRHVGHST